MEDYWKSGIIFLHFPENNKHGCDKHCSFCLFDKLNYNIPIMPTDEEIITFINKVDEGGTIQLCGAGDPLYNFEKHKDYLTHIVDIVHSTNRPVEVVTKYTEIVEKYFDLFVNNFDSFVFSVETKNNKIKKLIEKLLKANKKVRITKVANFTEDIKKINIDEFREYINFYRNSSDKFKICFRPNYNYEYSKEDFGIAYRKITELSIELGLKQMVYIHSPSKNIAIKQLWNGRHITCADTNKYIYKDMNIEEGL